MVICKLSIQGGILMIHSESFGRAFWLDDDNELCSAPWRKGGTVDEWVNESWDYVSEWNDLEGVDMGKLLGIHKELIIEKHTNTRLDAQRFTREQLKSIKGDML